MAEVPTPTPQAVEDPKVQQRKETARQINEYRRSPEAGQQAIAGADQDIANLEVKKQKIEQDLAEAKKKGEISKKNAEMAKLLEELKRKKAERKALEAGTGEGNPDPQPTPENPQPNPENPQPNPENPPADPNVPPTPEPQPIRPENDPRLLELRQAMDNARAAFAKNDYDTTGVIGRLSRSKIGKFFRMEPRQVEDNKILYQQYKDAVSALAKYKVEALQKRFQEMTPKERAERGDVINKEIGLLNKEFSFGEKLELYKARNDAIVEARKGTWWGRTLEFGKKATNWYKGLGYKKQMILTAALFATGAGAAWAGSVFLAGTVGAVGMGRRLMGSAAAGVGAHDAQEAGRRWLEEKQSKKDTGKTLDYMDTMKEIEHKFDSLKIKLNSHIDAYQDNFEREKKKQKSRKWVGLGAAAATFAMPTAVSYFREYFGSDPVVPGGAGPNTPDGGGGRPGPVGSDASNDYENRGWKEKAPIGSEPGGGPIAPEPYKVPDIAPGDVPDYQPNTPPGGGATPEPYKAPDIAPGDVPGSEPGGGGDGSSPHHPGGSEPGGGPIAPEPYKVPDIAPGDVPGSEPGGGGDGSSPHHPGGSEPGGGLPGGTPENLPRDPGTGTGDMIPEDRDFQHGPPRPGVPGSEPGGGGDGSSPHHPGGSEPGGETPSTPDSGGRPITEDEAYAKIVEESKRRAKEAMEGAVPPGSLPESYLSDPGAVRPDEVRPWTGPESSIEQPSGADQGSSGAENSEVPQEPAGAAGAEAAQAVEQPKMTELVAKRGDSVEKLLIKNMIANGIEKTDAEKAAHLFAEKFAQERGLPGAPSLIHPGTQLLLNPDGSINSISGDKKIGWIGEGPRGGRKYFFASVEQIQAMANPAESPAQVAGGSGQSFPETPATAEPSGTTETQAGAAQEAGRPEPVSPENISGRIPDSLIDRYTGGKQAEVSKLASLFNQYDAGIKEGKIDVNVAKEALEVSKKISSQMAESLFSDNPSVIEKGGSLKVTEYLANHPNSELEKALKQFNISPKQDDDLAGVMKKVLAKMLKAKGAGEVADAMER